MTAKSSARLSIFSLSRGFRYNRTWELRLYKIERSYKCITSQAHLNLHLFHELRSVIRSAQAEAHRHCANRTEHCSHSQQGKPVPLQDVQSEVDIMISQNPKSKLLLMDTPMIYSNATDHCSKASTISSFLPPFLCFHARGEGISHVFVASESTSTSASTLKINMKACTVV